MDIHCAQQANGATPNTNGDGGFTFVLSELKSAFIIGLVIFIPFLVLDMLVSAGLMSMGMMMVPPSIVSLPFKLLLFVVVDGWGMVTTALVGSYR